MATPENLSSGRLADRNGLSALTGRSHIGMRCAAAKVGDQIWKTIG
jgi:hypothetical protein